MESRPDRSCPGMPAAKGPLGRETSLCHDQCVNEQITRLLGERRPAVEELCRRLGIAQLDLFGSATGAGWEAGRSDMDFVVRFRSRPGQGLLDTYLALADGLEQIFGCHVDLVTERSIRNPCFRQSVESSRNNLYADREQEAVA